MQVNDFLFEAQCNMFETVTSFKMVISWEIRDKAH